MQAILDQLRPEVSTVTQHRFDLGGYGKGEVFIIRDDLIHPLISGNKLRKIHYQFKDFSKETSSTVVTGGGPWSNHLLAVGCLCHEMGLPAVMIIRGHLQYENTYTAQLRRWGINLRPVERIVFDDLTWRATHVGLQEVAACQPGDLVIPPGGDNRAGQMGCQAILNPWPDIQDGLPWVLATGYGTTLLGMLPSLEGRTSGVHAVSAISSDKAIEAMRSRIIGCGSSSDVHVYPCLHGAFGKIDEEGITMLATFHQQTGVLLDPLYNGKALLTYLHHRQDEGPFVLYHSGGVMGWHGMHARAGTAISDSLGYIMCHMRTP